MHGSVCRRVEVSFRRGFGGSNSHYLQLCSNGSRHAHILAEVVDMSGVFPPYDAPDHADRRDFFVTRLHDQATVRIEGTVLLWNVWKVGESLESLESWRE